ncbi:unnamed protein product [Lathyrus sativus]|nr:unnamed protein product [Lathyrus sativus]
MVMGNNKNIVMEDAENDGEEEKELTILNLENMKVEEHAEENYACPKFIFPKHEEIRIHRPWWKGVIAKLLDRRIIYKAMEIRLNQMWVKKGVINIIDLSNNYYSVIFSHEDDHNMAPGKWAMVYL